MSTYNSITKTYIDSTSTFPEKIDVKKFFRDLTIAEKKLVNQINLLTEQERFSEVDQIFADNPSLLECYPTADDWNRLMDICITLERFFRDNIVEYTANAISYQGIYSPTKEYKVFNLVSYQTTEPETGTTIDAYLAITDNIPIGTLPTNNSYFTPLTRRGQMGASGTGLSFRYDWDWEKTFYVDDILLHNNILWYAKQENINSEPTAESADWGVFFYLRIYSNGVIMPDNKTLEHNTIIAALDNPAIITGVYKTDSKVSGDYVTTLKWKSNNRLLADSIQTKDEYGDYITTIKIYKSNGITIDKIITITETKDGENYRTETTNG